MDGKKSEIALGPPIRAITIAALPITMMRINLSNVIGSCSKGGWATRLRGLKSLGKKKA